MKRVIICGGRDFVGMDETTLSKLDRILLFNEQTQKPIRVSEIEIVSGCTRGDDAIGELWAQSRGSALKKMPANWTRDGKRAGFIRNSEMLRYIPETGHEPMVIAFWDGRSRGTGHMIEESRKHGVPVHAIQY